MQQVNTLVQYIRSKWDIFKLQQNLCRNGARFRTQGSRNRDSCWSWGSRNPASGRGPRASCRGPKIRPAVPDLVLLVEVPKSSPRCGVLSGPLGGSGSHLDGTVVSVVRQVGRDLVFSVRGHVALSLSWKMMEGNCNTIRNLRLLVLDIMLLIMISFGHVRLSPIHAVFFIRDKMIFQLVLSLNFPLI